MTEEEKGRQQKIRRRMRMDRSMGSEVSGSVHLGVLETVATVAAP